MRFNRKWKRWGTFYVMQRHYDHLMSAPFQRKTVERNKGLPREYPSSSAFHIAVLCFRTVHDGALNKSNSKTRFLTVSDE
ncbi:30S ribosomal protein S12P domain protein [Oesophagostomum dentatum]|uniref:30S ribosomal protein S12P domain protein n=1 Tax=Oesophagostomum dentatum TaxID=61180 RepID=A0A0B1TDB6_OESDE|nr:30S ribosomal protein S12P domain protein [Oesophagostomum dentatum]